MKYLLMYYGQSDLLNAKQKQTSGCAEMMDYMSIYVDNLLIAAINPNEIVKVLKENHKFKLKGVGPLTDHLGCDCFQDKDGTWCYGPRKYISKMFGQFENMFGCKPREYTSTLEKGIIQK
jgi:hypothetical protein